MISGIICIALFPRLRILPLQSLGYAAHNVTSEMLHTFRAMSAKPLNLRPKLGCYLSGAQGLCFPPGSVILSCSHKKRHFFPEYPHIVR